MWKKLDYNLIRVMYVDQELSAVEIAKQTGWAKASIRRALLSMKVPLRNKSEAAAILSVKRFPQPPTKGWLEDLMAQHKHNARAASTAAGVNYWTFRNHLKKHAIQVRPSGEALVETQRANRIEIPIEEAVQLSLSGIKYEELAKMYGVSKSIVAKRLKEAGHEAPKDLHRKNPKGFESHPPHHRKVLQALGISACQVCGETRALDLAHIKPRRKSGPNDSRNCLVLCATHHRCFDRGTLTVTEFEKIEVKVRAAEKIFDFKLSHFVGWCTFC